MAETITFIKTADGYSIDVPRAARRAAPRHYDRAAIMRRAHVIKSERREAIARRIYAEEAQVVAGRPVHTRTFEQVLKATPVDFSAAMRAAWAEAKAEVQVEDNALVVAPTPTYLPALRGGRIGKVVQLLVAVAAFLESRFIPSRLQ